MRRIFLTSSGVRTFFTTKFGCAIPLKIFQNLCYSTNQHFELPSTYGDLSKEHYERKYPTTDPIAGAKGKIGNARFIAKFRRCPKPRSLSDG